MKTLLEASIAMMAIADPDGDCTDLWAKDMREAIARWDAPKDLPRSGVDYDDYSMERCVYALIYNAAQRFADKEKQDFRVIARDAIDAAHEPLAGQYEKGYEHGHADATREIIENWNCSSHEEDVAWDTYNGKFSWGHEPTAKGLFVDGHRSAVSSGMADKYCAECRKVKAAQLSQSCNHFPGQKACDWCGLGERPMRGYMGSTVYGDIDDHDEPSAFAQSLEPVQGYVDAFYDLAGLLKIGAQDKSPRDVWYEIMFPRLAKAIIALEEMERAR